MDKHTTLGKTRGLKADTALCLASQTLPMRSTWRRCKWPEHTVEPAGGEQRTERHSGLEQGGPETRSKWTTVTVLSWSYSIFGIFFHCGFFALILIFFFKEKCCIKGISLAAEFSGAPLDCVPEGSTLLFKFVGKPLRQEENWRSPGGKYRTQQKYSEQTKKLGVCWPLHGTPAPWGEELFPQVPCSLHSVQVWAVRP